MSWCFRLFMRGMELTSYMFVWNHFRLVELPWDSPWTWWLAFLAVDFGYYVVHRSSHGTWYWIFTHFHVQNQKQKHPSLASLKQSAHVHYLIPQCSIKQSLLSHTLICYTITFCTSYHRHILTGTHLSHLLLLLILKRCTTLHVWACSCFHMTYENRM